jgi:CRISPR-associated protein Cmr2
LPTLSIGIGIGHVMEGMGDLLALGREAEREAKQERNSLAVLVDMRSGGRRSWSATWDTDAAGSLRKSIQHLDELLPTGKVYEIATVIGRLPRESHDAQWAAILTREVERALFRVGEGSLTSAQVDLDLNAKTYIERRQRVEDWVNRVLIARVLARSVPSQRPRAVDVGV